jgi:hypothetical protein
MASKRKTTSQGKKLASSNQSLSAKVSHADGKEAKEGFLRVQKMIEDVTALREKAHSDSCLGQAELRFYEFASKLTKDNKKNGVTGAGRDLASMVQGYHRVRKADLPDMVLEHEYLAFQDNAYLKTHETATWLGIWRSLKTWFLNMSADSKSPNLTMLPETPQQSLVDLDKSFIMTRKERFQSVCEKGDVRSQTEIEDLVSEYCLHVIMPRPHIKKYFEQSVMHGWLCESPNYFSGGFAPIEKFVSQWADHLMLHCTAKRFYYLSGTSMLRRFTMDKNTNECVYLDIKRLTPGLRQSAITRSQSKPATHPNSSGNTDGSKRVQPPQNTYGGTAGVEAGTAAGGDGGGGDDRNNGGPRKGTQTSPITISSSSSDEEADKEKSKLEMQDGTKDSSEKVIEISPGSKSSSSGEHGSNQENVDPGLHDLGMTSLYPQVLPSGTPYVRYPLPENGAIEHATNMQIERELRDPGIISEGLRPEDIRNVIPAPMRLSRSEGVGEPSGMCGIRALPGPSSSVPLTSELSSITDRSTANSITGMARQAIAEIGRRISPWSSSSSGSLRRNIYGSTFRDRNTIQEPVSPTPMSNQPSHINEVRQPYVCAPRAAPITISARTIEERMEQGADIPMLPHDHPASVEFSRYWARQLQTDPAARDAFHFWQEFVMEIPDAMRRHVYELFRRQYQYGLTGRYEFPERQFLHMPQEEPITPRVQRPIRGGVGSEPGYLGSRPVPVTPPPATQRRVEEPRQLETLGQYPREPGVFHLRGGACRLIKRGFDEIDDGNSEDKRQPKRPKGEWSSSNSEKSVEQPVQSFTRHTPPRQIIDARGEEYQTFLRRIGNRA